MSAKEMTPETQERTKAFLVLTFKMATSSGTSATQANQPRLNGGNARNSKTLDRSDARTGREERKMSTIRNTDISPSVY